MSNSDDKLDMQSPDLVNHNIEKLAKLFPNCVTESATGKAIDFDLLKQELNHSVIEGNKERYRLEWPGKREAIVTTNLPTTKTLRPVLGDSVDFDNTENVYIEGDNLEVLKLLQESYLGKIKMIYIDPPYNTGNDFVYKDNFAKDKEDELFESGQKDELSQRLMSNPETSGRYHSDWLSMVYPRIKLARNLLTSDGVIMVSIDNNEVQNLRSLMNETFGETNFIAQIVWKKKYTGGQHAKFYADLHEYILVFGKSVDDIESFGVLRSEDDSAKFTEEDEYVNSRGKFYTRPLKSNLEERKTLIYPIEMPDGTVLNTQWLVGKERFEKEFSEKRIVFRQKKNGEWQVYKKYYQFDGGGITKPPSLIERFPNTEAKSELKVLFNITEGRDNVFYTVKPVNLLKYLFEPFLKAQDICLDFFSGAGTSANAVLEMNSQDNGQRKFIMVQIPEVINTSSNSDKFHTICDLGKERIRRAAKKIKDETGAQIDYGFRVYRLDESNMQDVYYRPQDYDQAKMDLFGDNVKPDRNEDDLLAQVMLDWGLPLSLKIEQANLAGKKVFKVAENSLFACFDRNIDEAFAKEIAKEKPLRIVFKDAGFKDDTAKTNVKQLLKQLSPETEMKVL